MNPILILTTLSTSLSIVGCVIIFTAYKVWQELRSTSRRILLYITFADFLTAVGYLALREKCVVQSFVTTTSSMMSFYWTCCLALYLHAISVNVSQELGRRIVFAFHCIAWPLPFLLTLIACLFDALGPSGDFATGEWCWIEVPKNYSWAEETRGKPVLWMLFTGKLWEILSYVVILIVYVKIWVHIRQHKPQVVDNNMAQRVRSVEIRILMMPLAYILIRMWGTIRFIQFAANSHSDADILQYFQAFGDGSQGFVNAVMFCLATEKAKRFFTECCCTERNMENDSLLEHSVQNRERYGADDN